MVKHTRAVGFFPRNWRVTELIFAHCSGFELHIYFSQCSVNRVFATSQLTTINYTLIRK